MMHFDEAEDREWAGKLLPTSGNPHRALATPFPWTPMSADDAQQAAAFSLDDGPLKGVRYASLTAPGPSGTRPEHISDMLSVARRTDANKLQRALAMIYAAVDSGALPTEARWLTRTRLCWQRKKTGKPRPAKMGEFLRSAYAKKLISRHKSKLRKVFLGMRQRAGDERHP